MSLEYWVKVLCIEENKAYVAGMVPIIVRNIRALHQEWLVSGTRRGWYNDVVYRIEITTSMYTNKSNTILSDLF